MDCDTTGWQKENSSSKCPAQSTPRCGCPASRARRTFAIAMRTLRLECSKSMETKSTELAKVLDDQAYVEKGRKCYGHVKWFAPRILVKIKTGPGERLPPPVAPSIDHLRFTVRGDSPLNFLTLTWTYGTRIHRGFCVWKGWNWIKHGRSTIWEWSTHAAAWAARAKGIVPVRARDFKNNHLVRHISGVLLCSLLDDLPSACTRDHVLFET